MSVDPELLNEIIEYLEKYISSKDPAFLLYSKDWLEGTAELLPNEKGVFIDLLAYQHQKGSLPVDTKRLSKLASISEDEFLKDYWIELEKKFIEIKLSIGPRLINLKLTKVMMERKSKSHRNRISAIFAVLIRKADLTKDQYKVIRSEFSIDNFIQYNSDDLTDKLTDWFNKTLSGIKPPDPIKQKKETIDERKIKFQFEINQYLGTYKQDMLDEFFVYWSQHEPNDKKMLFEKKQVFQIPNRLSTWHKKNITWKNKNGKPKQEKYKNDKIDKHTETIK